MSYYVLVFRCIPFCADFTAVENPVNGKIFVVFTNYYLHLFVSNTIMYQLVVAVFIATTSLFVSMFIGWYNLYKMLQSMTVSSLIRRNVRLKNMYRHHIWQASDQLRIIHNTCINYGISKGSKILSTFYREFLNGAYSAAGFLKLLMSIGGPYNNYTY